MKKILSLVTLLCVALVLHGAVVNYTADNTTVFPNPERGFYVHNDKEVTASDSCILNGSSSSLTSGTDASLKANMRLALMVYYLSSNKTSDIPQSILNGFSSDMAVLRSIGWKCVLRFAYTKTDGADATLSWVQRHLEQLKPYLAANADVIYVVQAGFIGKYGEWYYSDNYCEGGEDHSSHMNTNRRAVADALFTNMPEDRFIQFRTPMCKFEYDGTYATMTALTSSEAFKNTKKARWGHHNDAFLNTGGDMGTYTNGSVNDDPAVRQYTKDETQYVPIGGESNISDDGHATSIYASSPDSMAAYHWSYCNYSFSTTITDLWREHGQYTTMNRYVGYRYNLISGTFTDAAVVPNGTMNVKLSLTNVGYAPIYNQRTAYIVLRNGRKKYSMALTSDPRRWAPGETINIDEDLTIPSDIAGGTYRLYLWMPDSYASISKNPRYAVRFANTGVWDEETGLNDLGVDIVVNAPAADDPAVVPGDQSLSEAIRYAHDGDIIELAAGTYTEPITFAINKNITVKAASGASVIIKPSAQITIPDNVTVKFENVKFDLSIEKSNLFASTATTGNNYLILEGCEVYGYNVVNAIIKCASDKKLDYCIIENCKIYNNKKSFIFFNNADTKYLRISNSSFYNITKDGSGDYIGIIDCRTSSGKIHVDHCTFYDCMAYNSDFGAIGYRTNAGYQTKVSNSIFQMKESNSDIRAIYLLETESRNVVENCLTYNYTKDSNTGVHSGPTLSGVNKFNTNPLFTDAEDADFTLQTSPTASPCLRASSDGSHMGDPRWWPTGTNINITIPASGYKTYVTTHALNFSGISGLKAYVAKSANASGVTMTQVGAVPAGTPLVLIGTANTYNVPVIDEASASAPDVNLLRAGDGYTEFNLSTYDYILYSDGLFYRIDGGSVPYGKAYLHLDSAPSSTPGVRIIFEDNNATSFESVETKSEATKFIENGKLFIMKNGITYDALGRIIR